MSCNSFLVDISRNDFIDAEYCALLGKGNTSHGYCKRSEWPPPFSWARYMAQGSGLSKVVQCIQDNSHFKDLKAGYISQIRFPIGGEGVTCH